MLKFIEGDDLVREFHKLMKKSTSSNLAVAFSGKNASARLNIKKGSNIKIICNLKSGACNPDEIQKLRSLIEIKTHDQIHAKVYLTDNGAIIGSSNASANGLAVSALEASGWREANIVVDDRKLLASIKIWFGKMWKDARPIKSSDIELARTLWAKRRQLVAQEQA
jgi:hypothetical protein